MIEMQTGVAGFYMLEAVNIRTGKKRILAPWFKNLITDIGLDRLANASSNKTIDYCHIGTGSTAPAVTDTTLAAFQAASNQRETDTSGMKTTSPYYSWQRVKYRFNPPAAAGNISEVGVGWGAGAGVLFSRALILSGGVPTTITVLSDEYLDVTYEIRVYPNETDVVGSATISGVTYTTTTRPSNVSTVGWWRPISGTFGATMQVDAATCYSGPIGPITGAPSGTADSDATFANATYVAGSFQRTATVTIGLSDANFGAGGIQSFAYGSNGNSRIQIGFSPAIPKTSTQTLVLNITHSWARKTL